MKIYLAGDHAGFELKALIAKELKANGHEVQDFGAHEFSPSDDYPDFVSKVSSVISADHSASGSQSQNSMAIIFGGSGQGEAMVANRTKGVRAVVFYGPVSPKQAIDVKGELSTDPYSIIRLARMHNNANVLSLGARFVSENEAKTAVKIFLETEFSNDERHQQRLAKF